MSYRSQTPGKEVWGTTNYKIHLQTSSGSFSNDFSGKLVLYERRWVMQELEFMGISQFVTALKDLWKASIRQGNVQDARLARWVEEYLIQENIDVTYEQALSAIKGESVDYSEIDQSHSLTHKEVLTDFLKNEADLDQDKIGDYIGASDEIIPQGYTIPLTDINIADNPDEFLSALFEKHKPARAKTIGSSLSFVDSNGKEQKIDRDLVLEDSPLVGSTKVDSGFKNTLNEAIRDIEFEDTIPFEFTLDDVSVVGNAKKLEERVEPEGLKVKWQIEELGPSDDVSVEYYLGKRIMRSILTYSDENVNLINTFEPIKKVGDKLMVDAYFVNQSSSILKKVKVIDQIPKELDLIDSKPSVDERNVGSIGTDSMEIQWDYLDVNTSAQFQVHYDLKERAFIIRDLFEVHNPEGIPLMQCVRIIKELKYQPGYGIIFAVRAHQELSDPLEIIDKVTANTKVETILAEEGYLVVSPDSIVQWKIGKLARDTIVHSYLRYIPENSLESSQFTVKMGEKSTSPTSVINSKRETDTIVMPLDYHKLVDIKS